MTTLKWIGVGVLGGDAEGGEFGKVLLVILFGLGAPLPKIDPHGNSRLL